MTQDYFCGSYHPTDVRFLLTVLDKKDIADTDPTTKEHLIQTGQKHYSQMLSLENPPDDTHMAIYHDTLERHADRYAHAIHHLSHGIDKAFDKSTPLVLVSLVRAGVPVGVLLQRAFDDTSAPYHRQAVHYGISIIRDKGIDHKALEHILHTHPKSKVVFVDGWTGKGAIFGELLESLDKFCQTHPTAHEQIFHHDIPPLVVISDPAGVAWLSAGDEDWLMPSSLLNSTISGLISRTLWADDAYHGVVYYDEFDKCDQSLAFVECIDRHRQQIDKVPHDIIYHTKPRFSTSKLINDIAYTFDIDNKNRIKPTLAEATRAIIRREPDVVILNTNNDDNALIRHLCHVKGVPIIYQDILPYHAITLIKKRR